MQREIKVASYEAAANFVYLEHLLRITTLDAEVQAVFPSLPVEVRMVLNPLLAEKKSSPQRAIRRLEATITSGHLSSVISPQARINLLVLARGSVSETLKDPSASGVCPVLYLLQVQSKFFALYLPEMSYLDGYDPYREEDHFPIIPESFLTSIKSMLYTTVQVRPAKRKKSVGKTEQAPFVAEVALPPKKVKQETFKAVMPKPLVFAEVVEEDQIVIKQATEIGEVKDDKSDSEAIEEADPKPRKSRKSYKPRASAKKPQLTEEITYSTPQPQDWKEVEYRINNQRKARDECGVDCRVF